MFVTLLLRAAEYKIENDQSWLFSLFKLKDVGCWSAAACWRKYEIGSDKTLLFALLKREKCTMYVTFLPQAY